MRCYRHRFTTFIINHSGRLWHYGSSLWLLADVDATNWIAKIYYTQTWVKNSTSNPKILFSFHSDVPQRQHSSVVMVCRLSLSCQWLVDRQDSDLCVCGSSCFSCFGEWAALNAVWPKVIGRDYVALGNCMDDNGNVVANTENPSSFKTLLRFIKFNGMPAKRDLIRQ